MAARVPLVLLPALLCDGDLYRAQIDALGDIADARVIVASESSLAKSAQVVLAQAPPRFALGGTSAGGNLALEVLATAPERVVGFWLTGTNAAAHSDPAGARGLSERARRGEFARVVDELAERCIHRAGSRGSEALATLRTMALRAGVEVFLRQNEAVITRADRSAVFKTLGVPTLFLWGRHDRFSPPERAEAYAAGLPSARIVVVEDSGHLPTLEHPAAATLGIREWLTAL
ncbi:MAG: alpha/beta hydrolase [Candidatus Rokuibacteriota bacterium]|nr:MAG: alpha/beta hydrolase [Candidatus Rokubacteria bacterium]